MSVYENLKKLKIEIPNAPMPVGAYVAHKISPGALGCGIKKLFKKKDGSPNALGKFYNTKTLSDLWKK